MYSSRCISVFENTQGARDSLRNLRDLIFYYIPVVQDYICALKMRDYDRVHNLWWHLLVVLGRFRCEIYVDAMLYSACQLQWLRRYNRVVYNFIKSFLAAFDEERGEVSFYVIQFANPIHKDSLECFIFACSLEILRQNHQKRLCLCTFLAK